MDSDDWVDEESLQKILELLRNLEEEDNQIDMLVSNYVYEKVGANHKKCIHYRNALLRMRFSAGMIWAIFTWISIF